AQSAGIKICIASGRTRHLVEDALEKLPFADFLSTGNGAMTYDLKKNKVISSNLIPAEKAKKIFTMINERKLQHEIYFEGNCFVDGHTSLDNYYDNIPEVYRNILRNAIITVDDLSEHIADRGVEKISIMYIPKDVLDEYQPKLYALGELSTTSSVRDNLETNSIYANKGNAMKAICSYIGISTEEVMTFGDSGNDKEMLEASGYSYAVANAWEETKKAAKHITAGNMDDGVAVAIEQYLETEYGS
nr:HAD hydrolase family protein [Clostridiales bacterium]